MKKDKKISFDVEDVLGIFDEKGNISLELRKVSWNEREPKLELRKWNMNSDGEQTPNKGFSFLTDEGPHMLTELLVENNFGNTKTLYELLKEREDFMDDLEEDIDIEEEE